MKKKLTKEQRAQRKKNRLDRQAKYKTMFINGKQVKMKKSPEIDGFPVEEFLRRNDPFYSYGIDYSDEDDTLECSSEDLWV
ncbi:TPA: hypothetical protein ACX6RU_001735 [Photobacterium damselae]